MLSHLYRNPLWAFPNVLYLLGVVVEVTQPYSMILITFCLQETQLGGQSDVKDVAFPALANVAVDLRHYVADAADSAA